MILDYELTPSRAGTRLASTAALTTQRGLKGAVIRTVFRLRAGSYRKSFERFRDAIEADYAGRQEGGPAAQLDVESIAATAADAVAGWNALTR